MTWIERQPNPSTMTIDPQVRETIDEQSVNGIPGSHASSVETARRQFRETMLAQSLADVDAVREFSVPGPAGDITIRTYTPEGESPRPILAFFHGGGWVLGDLDCYDHLCSRLARETGCLVASCEYRRAPEHPFPAAPRDCYAATEWLSNHADEVGGDPDRLAVAGTSAGGNLAAAVTLLARDRGGPSIAHQTLMYPVVNPVRLDRLESYSTYAEGYTLTTASLERFYDEYIADPVDGRNAYAFPLVAHDHSNLPPATIVSAEFDPLRDEAFEYAQRLKSEAVPVSHHHYEGMTHDFLSMTDTVDRATEGIETVARELTETI
ncbi:alpha/beta hydrolase [Halorarum halobium]|uniref:alpha/beta hydrolase n=1 Tax=Halorarum halobium TaxID=3075121 RepID=UPI0028A78EAE|nr:alpha/beta hydrolase [Halobaculum sp. XH14]